MERINYSAVNEVHIVSGAFRETVIKDADKVLSIVSLVRLIKKKSKKNPYFQDTPQLRGYRIDLYNGQQLIGGIVITGINRYWNAHWDDHWHFIPLTSEIKKLARKIIQGLSSDVFGFNL